MAKTLTIVVSLKSAAVLNANEWALQFEAPDSESIRVATIAGFVDEVFMLTIDPEPDDDGRKANSIRLIAKMGKARVERDGLWTIPMIVSADQRGKIAAVAMMTHTQLNLHFVLNGDADAHLRA